MEMPGRVVGSGVARGADHAREAAERAVAETRRAEPFHHVNSVVVHVDAGEDLTLDELYEAAETVYQSLAEEDGLILTGCAINESPGEEMRVTIFFPDRYQSPK
jgi:cell division GTPase FtsZ